MNRDDIDRLWHQALHQSVVDGETFTRYHFAALVAAAEREAMIADGWRQCAKGQRTTQFCGQAEQARLDEREECAKVCDVLKAKALSAQRGKQDDLSNLMLRQVAELGHAECAAAIRARGNHE